jgi:hypothetical protein
MCIKKSGTGTDVTIKFVVVDLVVREVLIIWNGSVSRVIEAA